MTDTELQRRHNQLVSHVRKIFREAERQGLYLGAGRDPRLDADQQEGPLVKKLKRLVDYKEGVR